MKAIDADLLKKIVDFPAVPGFEKKFGKFLISELKKYADEVKTDRIGNVIFLKKGKKNPKKLRVLVSAHMDEIGFMVKEINNEGFVFFQELGGFDPKSLTALRVTVHGKKDFTGVMGSVPLHMQVSGGAQAPLKVSDFFIDLGLPAEEVRKYVNVGDPISRKQPFEEMGNFYNGKSLDNRVGVYALAETLRNLGDVPYDFYAVFSVQEELGIRGATTVAGSIKPDLALALDTTIANDLPGQSNKITEAGKGTAIKIFDKGIVSNPDLVKFMQKIAKKENITYQNEILPFGRTDAYALQLYGENGAITGAISVPTRYIHQTVESVHKDDLLQTVLLTTALIEQIDKFKELE